MDVVTCQIESVCPDGLAITLPYFLPTRLISVYGVVAPPVSNVRVRLYL